MIDRKQIKIAVVGLGHWGPNLIRVFESDNRVSQVIGIENSFERRQFISKKNPNLSILSSLEEGLNDDSIDAFAIATPTQTHYSLGLKCLQANKHLFIEKPLSYTSASAQHLVDLARQKQKVLMTGHIFLYNQAIRKMKESIQNNELGDILYVKSTRTNLGPIRNDVNALWDLAAHDLSVFDYIFNQTPSQVSCRVFSLLGLEQQDVAIGTLEYNSNKTATFFVSWLDPVKTRQLTIVGSNKMLVFDDMQQDSPLTIHDKRVHLATSDLVVNSGNTAAPALKLHVGNTYSVPVRKNEPLKEECCDFVDCIFSGKNPQSDGENGLRIINQLEALVKSYSQNGALISL